MLFISDTQYYVPIKLCRMAESIHPFKITGLLTLENVKLKRKYNLGHNRIRLEERNKFEIRHIVKRETLVLSYYIKARLTLVYLGIQQS